VAAHLLAEPGPGADELQTLLTIAARVPDHGRLAPWRFIVIEGEARRRIGETIATAFQTDQPMSDGEKVAAERNRLARAPLVVAVVSRAKPHVKIPDWEQVLSAGAVCMNRPGSRNGTPSTGASSTRSASRRTSGSRVSFTSELRSTSRPTASGPNSPPS
jgi:hypothetical protein